MCYTLKKATNNFAIAEQEYICEQNRIGFTKFDSCIGVVALTHNNTLSAVHLVFWDKNDQSVDDQSEMIVNQLKGILKNSKKVFVIGCIDIWRGNSKFFYPQLVETFVAERNQIQTDRGVVYAEIINSTIIFTCNGQKVKSYTI